MQKWLVQAGICLVFALALAGTAYGKERTGAQPVQFDLSKMRQAKLPNIALRKLAMQVPSSPPFEEPDPAPKKFTAPAAEMPIGNKGATLGVGAFGSRHRGVPKLAHIVIDWDF